MTDNKIDIFIELKMRYRNISVDPDKGDTLDVMVNDREVLFTLTSEHLRKLAYGETLPIETNGGFYGWVRPMNHPSWVGPNPPPPQAPHPLPTPRSPEDRPRPTPPTGPRPSSPSPEDNYGFDFLRFFRRHPKR